MAESSGKGSNSVHKEPCREGHLGLSKTAGLKLDPGKDGGAWTNRPTPEIVQRLIKWLSDEMK
ncbi:MAG: hypothetical protein A2Z14_10115 [Chloroflexi bacterium RBG_16_48_8]|nr:MAG: hypothetical protein A2Z14_10115 [Chloroflexi bacterium RBG_16_48_8]